MRQYVKADSEIVFTPTKEKLFQLENGYYLLFYHRQKVYTMFILYLRFLVPLALLYYGIKKNPFYKSYPIMLPFMVILFAIVFYRMIKYSRRTN